MSQRSLYDKILLVIKGLAMGVANKIPGVSGGIVAVVTGFYEEFLYSLKRLNFKAFRLLINGRFSHFIQYTNARFLLLISLGILISYFTVSNLLDLALLHFEKHVKGLFFGMVMVSAILLIRDFKHWNFKYISFCAIGLIVGLLITLLDPAPENRDLLFVFFCGAISIIGMTLPGLSGSFLLILLGNYALLLVDSVNALGEFTVRLIAGDETFRVLFAQYGELLTILAVFIVGSISGLIVISNVLHYILTRYESKLRALIIGFIIGSLPILWPWSKFYLIGDSNIKILSTNTVDETSFFSLLWIGIGGLIVVALDLYDRKKQ